MTPSEKVALGRELELMKLTRPVGRPSNSENLPELPKGREKREVVGEALGMSGPTYQRAKAVVDRFS